MKNSKIIISVFLVTILVTFLVSCKKKTTDENTTPSSTYTSTASDNALAEQSYDDIQNIGKQAIESQGKYPGSDTIFMGPCENVTLDMTVFPFKVTIDFGTENCLCLDGKTRRGKIFVTFTGAYQDSGTVITHTVQNYFVNDNQILGTKVVTNLGHNPAGHPIFSVVVTDGQVIKPNNGGTITWASARQNEWTAGYLTPQWWDDIYLITGSASGIAANGKSYTMTVQDPLKVALNCYWIESGSIDLQIQDFPLITLDYGDGTCNNQATVTFLGQTYNITI
jgi:hypothetical protein